MKRVIAYLLCMLSSTGMLIAVETGEQGFPLFTYTPAREASVGDAGVALLDSSALIGVNPAALGTLTAIDAGVDYIALFSDMSYISARAGFPLGKSKGVAVSVSLLHFGNITQYVDGVRYTTISPYDLAVTLGYGMLIVENLYLGGNAKLLYETLSQTYSGFGFAFDAGLSFTFGRFFQQEALRSLRMGVAMRNAGFGPTYAVNATPLPFELAVGLAYTITIARANVDTSGSEAEANAGTGRLRDIMTIDLLVDVTPISPEGVDVGGGTELTWHITKAFSATLCVGYVLPKENDPISGLRAGAGITFEGMRIDYGFQYITMLGATHTVGIRYAFPAVTADVVGDDAYIEETGVVDTEPPATEEPEDDTSDNEEFAGEANEIPEIEE